MDMSKSSICATCSAQIFKQITKSSTRNLPSKIVTSS